MKPKLIVVTFSPLYHWRVVVYVLPIVFGDCCFPLVLRIDL